MSTDERLKYLLPENIESFWLWDENFETVTWWNGETIAFYQEISDVINHLKPFGLPLFSELILVLAACRKNWAEPGGGKALFATYLQSLDENPLQNEAGSDVIADWVKPILKGLDNVHAHFLEKPNLDRKKSILESIFEDDGHHVNRFDSSGIWIVLQTGNHAAQLKERHPVGRFDLMGNYVQVAPADGKMIHDGLTEKLVTTASVLYVFNYSENEEGIETGGPVFSEIAGEVLTHRFNFGRSVDKGEPVATIRPTRTPTVGFIQTIRNLIDVLPNLEAFDSLETREETGMDQLPDAAEDFTEGLPDSVAARNLIRDLVRDDEDENAGIGRVARNLLGILNVPRDVSDPDDMPLGGFSDIANKGDLDRLLLSELAQDDEVLAVRVALNEALYLRRETPPQDPPRQRRIFIDTGIRMWGLPRAFGHAAGLALVATMEQRDAAFVFSPDAEFKLPEKAILLPVELTSREKLTDALGRLSPAPHPGVHVRKFLKEASTDLDDCDRILITHPNALADEEFRAVLRETVTDEAPLLVVAIDEFGELVMTCRTASGERELRRLMLDVEILNQAPAKKKHISLGTQADRETDVSWPLILQLDEFPLRVAHPCSKLSWTNSKGEVITIVKSGVVLFYPDPQFGAIQITDSFRYSGQCIANEFDSDGTELILVFGKKLKPQIVVIDLERKSVESQRTELSEIPIFAMCVDRHVVFFSKKEATVFSIEQGSIFEHTLLDRKSLPMADEQSIHAGKHVDCRPLKVQDRFLFARGLWFVVSVAPEIKFTLIHFGATDVSGFPFECELYEEPLLLMPDGNFRVFDGDKNPEISMSGPSAYRSATMLHICDNGTRLVFKEDAKPNHFVICDLKNLTRTAVHLKPSIRDRSIQLLESRIATLRKNFQWIAVTGTGLILGHNTPSGVIIQQSKNGSFEMGSLIVPNKTGKVSFDSIHTTALGFDLRRAEFPDGSQAFLDARGMLHLKSSNPDTLEITFVLKDAGSLSGWLSNGTYFGQPYFCGAFETAISESEVTEVLERYLAQVRLG